MTRTWFPEAHYMPDGNGGYYATYKRYLEEPFTLVPGKKVHPTAGQAIAAAKAFLIKSERPIRAERATPANDDPLGVAAWHEERAASRVADQEQALGAIIVRRRQIKVERRKIA